MSRKIYGKKYWKNINVNCQISPTNNLFNFSITLVEIKNFNVEWFIIYP